MIIGRLIPAGTGAMQNRDLIVNNPNSSSTMDNDSEILPDLDKPVEQKILEQLV